MIQGECLITFLLSNVSFLLSCKNTTAWKIRSVVLKTVPLPRRPRFFTPCTPLCSAPSPWSALVFCGKPHVEQVSIARSVLFRNQTGKPERIMARLRYPVRGQPLVVVRPEIRFGTIATRDNVSSIIETFIPSPIQNCPSTYWLLLSLSR